jgi:hypothetical protein
VDGRRGPVDRELSSACDYDLPYSLCLSLCVPHEVHAPGKDGHFTYFLPPSSPKGPDPSLAAVAEGMVRGLGRAQEIANDERRMTNRRREAELYFFEFRWQEDPSTSCGCATVGASRTGLAVAVEAVDQKLDGIGRDRCRWASEYAGADGKPRSRRNVAGSLPKASAENSRMNPPVSLTSSYA